MREKSIIHATVATTQNGLKELAVGKSQSGRRRYVGGSDRERGGDRGWSGQGPRGRAVGAPAQRRPGAGPGPEAGSGRERGTRGTAAFAHLPGLLASPSRTCSSAQSASECSRQSWRKRAWVWLTRLSRDSSATVCSHSFQPLNQPASTPTWSRNIMVRGRPSVYKALSAPSPPRSPQSLSEPQPRGRRRCVPVPRWLWCPDAAGTASDPASLVWFVTCRWFWLIPPEMMTGSSKEMFLFKKTIITFKKNSPQGTKTE